MWKLYCFKIARFSIAYLPYRVDYVIAHFVAATVYLLSPRLRGAVEANIRHVLGPGVDEAKLKQVVKEVFRNAAKNYVDLVKMSRMKLEGIERCFTTFGWNNLENALKTGRGVVLVTAHLGSFDIASQVLAIRSVKTTIPVEVLEPPSLLSYVIALRTIHGLSFVPAQAGIIKVLIQAIRRGEVIVLACDRDIGNNGLNTCFFGEETVLPSVAVSVAMRTDAAVVPVFNRRRGIGKYDIYFDPPIDLVPAGNGATAKNMGKIVSAIEKSISSCPEQWVVLNRLWARDQQK